MKEPDDFLQNSDIPPPSETARRQAIAEATAHFARLQQTQGQEKNTIPGQGWRERLRLMVNTSKRRFTMAQLSSRTLLAGLASAGVTVLALFLVLPTVLMQPEPTSLEIPAPAPKKIPKSSEQRAETYLPSQEINTRYADAAEPVSKPPRAAPSLEGDIVLEEMVVTGDRAERSAHHSKSQVAGLSMRYYEPPASPLPAPDRNQFESYSDNPLKLTAEQPVSTFSVDVDTASYSFVRKRLRDGQLPARDMVRAEELINYFDYDYALPTDKSQPFAPNIGVMDSPWAAGKKLVHIGIKGYDLPVAARQRSNLVFLIDVSGSMQSTDKLPLLKQSLQTLLLGLQPDDTVAIVTYANGVTTALPPTEVKHKARITEVLQNLSASGGTAGGAGLQTAYRLAEENFDKEAVNRVMLATDGDFNIGISDRSELKNFIEKKRKSGIYLSVLGFGDGNYNDALMQALAQYGNGVAAYIDSLGEAQKVLLHEAQSSLFTIARDVKIQVEFNPATVAEYRLIGYETRALNREDFNNDAVDAGDIGAGHSVTAIYEITPVGSEAVAIDPSRYNPPTEAEGSPDEYGYLKMRYKLPGENMSKLLEAPIARNAAAGDTLKREMHFAAAVAAFAQRLRGSDYLPDFDYSDIAELAQAHRGEDPYGYRAEFVQLVRQAKVAAELE